MYITAHTNNSAQANSVLPLQQDFADSWGQAFSEELLAIEQVMDYYHQRFNALPDVKQRLLDRKVAPECLQRCKVGFADRSLGDAVPPAKVLAGAQTRGLLQRIGLLKPTGHEFFRGALVFPYPDANGNLAGAYGRRVHKQHHDHGAYHLYWNAAQVGFFHGQSLSAHRHIVLTKSPIDAMTLVSMGMDNVVATMGVQGFNDIQLQQLVQASVSSVTIAFDNTPEANHYAQLVAQALHTCGIECNRLILPCGQDINRFVVSQTDAYDKLQALLDNAEPLPSALPMSSPEHEYAYYLPNDLVTISDCISFYLQWNETHGRSERTLSNKRRLLEPFDAFCDEHAIVCISDVNDEILSQYHLALRHSKHRYQGTVISSTTQQERLQAVIQLLSFLQQQGVVDQLLHFPAEALQA